MSKTTPLETITTLIGARQSKNFEVALDCYEPDATVVLQPGQTGSGEAAIRAFISVASELPLIFAGHETIEAGDLALQLSRYTLNLGANGTVAGRTADVLRLQPDGTWRIVIGNAWAASDPSVAASQTPRLPTLP